MPIARPRPVFGPVDQTSPNRVAMNVPELLDPLAPREDVEIVIARLPERAFASAHRDGNLHRLNGGAEQSEPGFGDEEVYVFGHDDVAENAETIAKASTFQSVLKQSSCRR